MDIVRVFVSYSHEDERWFDTTSKRDLVPWLARTLQRDRAVFWYDRVGLDAGDRYMLRIKDEIARAQISVLLVSNGFISSKFIEQVELPLIRARVACGEMVAIPILVEPCLWEEDPFLRSRQMLPGKPTPLIDYTTDREWAHVRYEIMLAIRERVRAAQCSGRGDTVSNPHYADDLKTLEDVGYDLSSVLGSQTILIVTGCSLQAELLDRPAAEAIRDEIDRRGDRASRKRAVIVGDMWWHRESSLQHYPVISIGAQGANGVTGEIASKGTVWEFDGMCGAFLRGEQPRVALWGASASQTAASVRRYCEQSDGLDDFLAMCWK